MSDPLKQLEADSLQLAALFMKWDRVAEAGSTSTIWTDGHELNVIRNQIIDAKKKVGSYISTSFRECATREIPPQMSELYMVHADEIMANAKETLEVFRENADYQYLVKNSGRIDVEQRTKLKLNSAIYQPVTLEKLIKRDRLIKLKQYMYREKYLNEFQVCRKKLECLLEELKEMKPPEPKEPRKVVTEYHQTNIFPDAPDELVCAEEQELDEKEDMHKNLVRYGHILADASWTGEVNVRVRIFLYQNEKYLDYMKDGIVFDVQRVDELETLQFQKPENGVKNM